MGSQYLLANNDSAETITVKFKHCGETRNSIGIMYNIIYIIYYRFCGGI